MKSPGLRTGTCAWYATTRSCWKLSGGLHSDFEGVEPLRYVELPIYHLDCIVNSRERREAKADRFEAASPGLETIPGWSVNNHYLPERFQTEMSTQVPLEDTPLITKVMDGAVDTRARRWRANGSQIEVTRLEEIDRRWPLRAISSEAYHATWLSVPPLTELESGRSHLVFVKVRNDGTETWPYGARMPAFRLGYRWMSSDGSTVVADGILTTFTADVRPGESILQPMLVVGPQEPGTYRIQFALAHEDVLWFGQGPFFPVDVRAR